MKKSNVISVQEIAAQRKAFWEKNSTSVQAFQQAGLKFRIRPPTVRKWKKDDFVPLTKRPSDLNRVFHPSIPGNVFIRGQEAHEEPWKAEFINHAPRYEKESVYGKSIKVRKTYFPPVHIGDQEPKAKYGIHLAEKLHPPQRKVIGVRKRTAKQKSVEQQSQVLHRISQLRAKRLVFKPCSERGGLWAVNKP